jgi:NAD(P)-dependent dehydrogenase (short-subunit alcohol dehydrogenase family)
MGIYDGKTVVITGGTSGIGLATAKLLLDGGARVLVTGRTDKTLDAAREDLGSGAIVLKSDAASLPDIEALAATVQESFGKLDVLFVNAGLARPALLEQTSEALYDEMFDLNAKGPYFTVQKLAPLMPSGSAIVLTTSSANEKGIPMLSTYGAAKAALRSFARTMATELLPRGIRVNAVSPGPIQTPIMGKSGAPPEMVDQFAAQMIETLPMKRWGQAEEVAKAVAFLAFDATFTTGAELPVDGGGTQL